MKKFISILILVGILSSNSFAIGDKEKGALIGVGSVLLLQGIFNHGHDNNGNYQYNQPRQNNYNDNYRYQEPRRHNYNDNYRNSQPREYYNEYERIIIIER